MRTAAGVGAMELVAMDMKARGMFLARTLSYQSAEFDIVTCEMSDDDTRLYDDCANLWMQLRDIYDREISDNPDAKKADLNSAYWSAHQRFFKEMCQSTKTEKLVQIAKKAVEEDNMCVVIGLQTTGEAALNRMMEQGDGADQLQFFSSCGDQFKTVIEKTSQFLTVNDDRIEGLHEAVDNMELPPNALDQIIDSLGGINQVAEMTGRSHRSIRNSAGSVEIQKRVKDGGDKEGAADSINTAERKNFQSGQDLVRPVPQFCLPPAYCLCALIVCGRGRVRA